MSFSLASGGATLRGALTRGIIGIMDLSLAPGGVGWRGLRGVTDGDDGGLGGGGVDPRLGGGGGLAFGIGGGG